jgi:hypothetical protein
MSERHEDKRVGGTEKVPREGRARRGAHHGNHRREAIQMMMMMVMVMVMLERGVNSAG